MVHDGTWPVECLLAFQTGDVLEDESDGEPADFDIDSDVSDADLLELKQELNKLGPEKAQRDLADATVAAQDMTLDLVLSSRVAARELPERMSLYSIRM